MPFCYCHAFADGPPALGVCENVRCEWDADCIERNGQPECICPTCDSTEDTKFDNFVSYIIPVISFLRDLYIMQADI